MFSQLRIAKGYSFPHLFLSSQNFSNATSSLIARYTSLKSLLKALNDVDGKPPIELSPSIIDRIDNMPQEVKDSYTYTYGAGSHAEIYATNKALLDDPLATTDDLLVYVNKTLGTSTPVTEIPFHTCPHCEYIATSVFFAFLVASIDIKQNYLNILKDGGDLSYEIKIYPANNSLIDFMHKFDYLKWQEGKPLPYEYNVDKSCPITLDDVKQIKDSFSDKIDTKLFIVRYIVYMDEKNNELKKAFLVFANLETENTVFVGETFKKLLSEEYKKQITSKRDLIFQMEANIPNKVKTTNEREFELKSINLLDLNIVKQISYILKSYNNENFSESDFLISPVSVYYDFYHPKDNFSFSLFVRPQNTDNISDSLSEVLYYLNKAHNGEYSYKIDNKANAYLKKMESARRSSVAISFVSLLSISVVILGMVGLMLLAFDKRKKEFAVLISYGATKLRLLCEICIESVIITTMGGLLGVFSSYFICKSGIISFYDYTVRFDCKMAIVAFGISLISGLLAVLPLVHKIFKLPPAKILRSL